MEVPSRVKANRCFLEGKHAESIRFYDEALTAQPNDVVCVCNRACAFFMMDLFRRCIKDCDVALKLEPSCLRAYLLKGRALASLKKFSQAKATWQLGLQQEHGDVELLLELRLLAQSDAAMLGGSGGSGGGGSSGVAAVSSALDPRTKTQDAVAAPASGAVATTSPAAPQRPQSSAASSSNSLVLSKRGGSGATAAGAAGGSDNASIAQYAQATAEVAARGLVQHGVGHAHIDERIALGYLQVNTGNFTRGIELFNELLETEPNLIAGYLGRGTAYALQGSLASAIRDFSQAITIDPNCVDAWKRRGQARAAKGFDNDAIFDLTKASLLQPDHEVFHQRGLVYYKQKNYRRGMEDFKRASEFDESNYLTWNHYGLCLNALGDSEQAITCYQRATQLSPTFKEAWTNMAQAHKELGHGREAEFFFNKAAKVDPSYMHSYHLRALYLFGSGRHSEAMADLRRGLQLSPTSVECRYMLAIVLHGLGLLKEALNEYAQCIKMKQDHVSWYNREIAVYLCRKIDVPWRSYNMDRDLDPYFKEAWCKRLHPSTLARYKRQTLPSKWLDVTQPPAAVLSSQMMQIIKAADFIGRALQNRSPGYLPNRRQYRMCGLAVLETAQTLRRLWAERITVPGNTSSGNQAAHPFGWRDMFDISVRWRQLSEPNDPVWWVDLLSPEQFEEGFGSHTPMITGQTRVVRYYPMFARAFPLMRQLINEQCNLSESSKDTISRATSCKDLYDVMRRDFWVVTSCESTSNPGTAHEGTRITLQYSAPEGYEFSIRTPGTPSRWAEYDKELEFVWNLLYEEAIKPDRDIERLSELILTLAFYWYNFMPLSRGTAACGYVAILSLFLSFDIWIESPQQPTQQVDWEAILTPSPQAFIATISPWMYAARCKTTLLADLPLVEQVTPTLRLAIEALNAINDNPPPFPVNATDPVDVSLALFANSIGAVDTARASVSSPSSTSSTEAATATATATAPSSPPPDSPNTALVPSDDLDTSSITTSNTASVSDTNAASDYSSAEDSEVAVFDDGINSLE